MIIEKIMMWNASKFKEEESYGDFILCSLCIVFCVLARWKILNCS